MWEFLLVASSPNLHRELRVAQKLQFHIPRQVLDLACSKFTILLAHKQMILGIGQILPRETLNKFTRLV
jgi:hypothetical protein